MTAGWTGVVFGVLCAGVVAWVLPAWVTARLVSALTRSGRVVTNYRGREVTLGLGVAWLVWAVGLAALSSVLTGVFATVPPLLADAPRFWDGVSLSFPQIPAVLVVGAFAFGLLDDVFGDVGSRGFRGHLSALTEGRLTTGALKLLGIGALAVAASVTVTGSIHLLTPTWESGWSAVVGLSAWALAALVIALSANLVNLTDLRPGRALKAYSVLAVLGVLSVAWSEWRTYTEVPEIVPPPLSDAALSAIVGAFLLGVLLLGPVAAVWRFDLGERAMLGDAGANAMGALAGYVLASNLPLWLLAVVAALLVALNLASERFSFSRVIERNRFLRWIDDLGRLRDDGIDIGPADGEAGNLVERGEGRGAPDADTRDHGQGKDGGNRHT